MKRTFYSCCLLFSLLVSGQENNAAQVWQRGTIHEEVPLKGHPYFEEPFKTGHLTLNGVTRVLNFRLNAYKGQIEIEDKKGNHFLLPKEKGQEVVFGGRNFLLMSYFDGDVLKEDYFIPLAQGNVSLFLLPRKTFIQAKLPEHGYDSFEPAVYDDTSVYFIQKGIRDPGPIRLATRPLLKFLGGHKSELKAYIKTHGLDITDAGDAVALINYYNSLE